ncbi:hypothetical protein Shyhy01_59160 [Streptomyces hygroscopicus subsp. hygroscopicus]|nr:hypothetical protein Shyhy01_59160 [Streptomyces hygroscopicus subsp. hygroscopicus]
MTTCVAAMVESPSVSRTVRPSLPDLVTCTHGSLGPDKETVSRQSRRETPGRHGYGGGYGASLPRGRRARPRAEGL